MDWQQAAAVLIVAVAAFWLLRRALRSRDGAAGCGGCGGCAPSPPRRDASPLIRIDEPVHPPLDAPAKPPRRGG